MSEQGKRKSTKGLIFLAHPIDASIRWVSAQRRGRAVAHAGGPRSKPRAAGMILAVALATQLALWARPASAEYSLAPGDIVEMSIVGMKDLRHRAQIDFDGKVSLPLAGSVEAAGLSVAALRARVQDLVGSKTVRQRLDDGRETSVLIEPDEVMLDIAEYRPVYVNGDVSKPGEVRFRSSLTVRQAVALAGGYDLMRFRLDNPFLQAADLESDMKSLAAEHAGLQSRIARLEAELNGGAEIAAASGGEVRAPVPAAFGAQIKSLEAERFKVRVAEYGQQTASLRTLIGYGDTALKSLTEQSSREEESSRLDEEDFKRNSALFDRGTQTINRVVDSRRVMLLGSTRLLQTKVQVERVRRELETDRRNLAQIDANRRLGIVSELQKARIEMEGLRARMAGTGQKLLYTSTVRSQLIKGAGGRPNIVVIRHRPGGDAERLTANEDMALHPGDVVEVSLVADLVPPDTQPKSAPSR